MAKNRDRMYSPELKVVHRLINGVEVVYLHDVLTDWSEGMNSMGVGILNTALMIGYDEKEKQIVKKTGKKSKDGRKIRVTLSQPSIQKSLISAVKYMGGIKGHTFIASPEHTITIETTSQHKAKIKLRDSDNGVVRTNHGHEYWNAGYTRGEDYLSSKIRKSSAEKVLRKNEEYFDILDALRNDFYDTKSNLNMTRKTNKMFTSSQIMLNLSDLVFRLDYFEDKVKKFHGIETQLPSDYSPKIRIDINKN
jgi:hypothetical protein